MDVSQQHDKVFHTVNRLALETVLEKMSITTVFPIKIVCVCDTQLFNDLTNCLCTLAYQQVDVVAHQTVGIEGTWWLKQ